MKFLQRLLPGDEHASLLGDIQEEAQHRSRLWHWWQLAAVAVVCSNQDARKHPRLASRAAAIGLATLYGYGHAAMFGAVWIGLHDGFYIGRYWLAIPAFGSHERLVGIPLILLGFALSGWIVARMNRSNGITMVLPYVRVVCLLWLTLPPIVSIMMNGGIERIVYARLLAQIARSIPYMVPLAGAIVAGAMLGLPSAKSRVKHA